MYINMDLLLNRYKNYLDNMVLVLMIIDYNIVNKWYKINQNITYN